MLGSIIAQPTNGLVAYYPFTGNANDASGNNLNGNVIGASPTTDRFGNTNRAYSFNGSSNYISFSSLPTSNVTNWTLSAWVLPSNLNQLGIVLSNGADDATRVGNGYGFGIGKYNSPTSASTGNSLLGIYSGVSLNKVNFTFSNTTTWRHLAMSCDVNGTVKFYVDGLLYSSTYSTGQVPKTPTKFSIGAQTFPNGSNYVRYFSGSIDEVRVYNRALTECEVIELAEKTLATPTFVNVPTTTPCPGTSVDYSINPVPNATSYEWYVSGNLKNTSPTTNYSYTWSPSAVVGSKDVKIYAKTSCITSPVLIHNLSIKPAPAKPTFSETHNIVCLNESPTFSVVQVPGVKYSWFITEFPVPAGVTVPIITDADEYSSKPIFIPSLGAKSVYARPYLNGCAGPSVGFTNIQVQICDQNTRQASVEETKNSVYPNPSNGSINLETNGTAGKAVIYDALGQIAHEIELRESVNRYQVNLTSKGLYTLKIETESEKRIEKIVVE